MEQASILIETSITDLLELDRFHRNLKDLSGWLRSVRMADATWDRAVRLLAKWQETQRLTATYALYGEQQVQGELLTNLQTMVDDLGKILYFKVKQQPTMTRRVAYFPVSFDEHKYGYKGFDVPVPCLVMLNIHPSDDDLESVLAEVQRRGHRPDVCLVIVLGAVPKAWAGRVRQREYYLIFLGDQEIKRTVLSGSALRTFKTIVANTVDVMRIQPYDPHGPVKPYMFRGRQSLLSLLIRETLRCYALVGPRQIGKTALMDKVQREIEQLPNTKVCRISCKQETPLALSHKLLRGVGVRTPPQTVSDACSLLSEFIQNTDSLIVFMIDEADDVVVTDKRDGYVLFWRLRNLWNETKPRCRFLFAGYQTLAAAVDEYDAPFFNFATPLFVGSLEPEAAESLITDPLSEDLDITFSDETLIREIADRVNRHPSLIHHFCSLLVEYLKNEAGRNVVQQGDIQAILAHPQYRERVLSVFWQKSLSTLQRLIASVMATSGQDLWTPEDLQMQLKAYDLELPKEQVAVCLEGMVIAGLCSKSPQALTAVGAKSYRFAHDLIGQHLQSMQLTGALVEQVKKGG